MTEFITTLREKRCHSIDKVLFPISQTVMLTLKRDDIITPCIEWCKPDARCYIKVTQQRMKRLARSTSTYIVHARIKDSITTTEALQATANLGALLQNGHFVTVFR